MSGLHEPAFAVSRLIERGYIHRVQVGWWRLGPVLCEWHGWWRWRLGICFGTWYAGVLLGPLVVTLGKRRFLTSSKWTVSWSDSNG